MEGVEEFGIIDIGFDAVIRSQQAHDVIKCVVFSITKNYGSVMAVVADSNICKSDAIELTIFAPTGRSLIRCTGRIIWHLQVSKPDDEREKYLVQIFITDISQIAQGRLDSLIHQRQAFTSDIRLQSGSGM